MVDSLLDMELLFQNVYIPLDSNLFVMEGLNSVFKIYEVYQPGPKIKFKQQLWGIWSQENGLKTTTIVKWRRRADLTGLTLRLATADVCIK